MKYLPWIIIFILLIILGLNRHSKSGIENYHSEIWADKAGYYVYLPFFFKYNLDVHAFPDNIDSKTGDGFCIDKRKGLMVTKYPYGLSLLWLPFWLVTNFISADKTGFGIAFHKMIDIAAIVYFIIGLFYLFKALRTKFNLKTTILAIVIGVLGSNVFYYAIFETGMSHIYSFAFCSILVYCIVVKNYSFIFFASLCILLIIRPVNAILFLLILLLFENNTYDIKERLKYFLSYKKAGLIIVFALLLFAPQIWYSYYLKQGNFTNLYPNEKFIFFASPKFFEIWFSPNNGMFLYAPLILLVIIMTFLVKSGWHRTVFILLFFMLYSYTYASWWSYELGCAFGHRGFVEFMPIMIFYLAIILERLKMNWIFLVLVIFSTIYTLKLTFSYDGCFYGTHDWDWNGYYDILFSKLK